jgi:hypothetical protein
MLTSLLPPGSDGIIVVFENECCPTFSYQVNGPNVQYLGRGDFHDPQYESMESGVSQNLLLFVPKFGVPFLIFPICCWLCGFFKSGMAARS